LLPMLMEYIAYSTRHIRELTDQNCRILTGLDAVTISGRSSTTSVISNDTDDDAMETEHPPAPPSPPTPAKRTSPPPSAPTLLSPDTAPSLKRTRTHSTSCPASSNLSQASATSSSQPPSSTPDHLSQPSHSPLTAEGDSTFQYNPDDPLLL
jgi:hypothetical protein